MSNKDEERLRVNKKAKIKTSKGEIVVKLFSTKAPRTVENFVGLATGKKAWVDPESEEEVNKPLYDGVIFHRVIKNFMIQGGDPLGNGTGGPGYKFEDEFDEGLKFNKPYLLAMANSGPNTNGSQFFITLTETPWLSGKHTIFGEVVEGKDVVDEIGETETGIGDRPLKDVVIEKIEIL